MNNVLQISTINDVRKLMIKPVFTGLNYELPSSGYLVAYIAKCDKYTIKSTRNDQNDKHSTYSLEISKDGKILFSHSDTSVQDENWLLTCLVYDYMKSEYEKYTNTKNKMQNTNPTQEKPKPESTNAAFNKDNDKRNAKWFYNLCCRLYTDFQR